MDKNARFILPGMYEHYGLNFKLLELMKSKPHLFYDNIKVGAVYGNFQFCIFDGGRIFGQYCHTTKEEMEYVTSVYNDVYGVPVRLIFTNPVIPEKHFKNRFGQATLEVVNANPMNEIVVNNPQLEQYIRDNYTNLSFISSTTKCLSNPDDFKAEISKGTYKMVCLDYNLNKNMKLLQSLDEDLHNQCEFLVNAICPPACPNRKEHYRLNGLYGLSYGKAYATQDCPIDGTTCSLSQIKSHNNLTPEEIYNQYCPQGFINFKLEGRTLGVVENALDYVRYMVKPEYTWEALHDLLEDDPGDKLLNRDQIILQSSVPKFN